jgi:hypothetical protein
VYYKGERGEIMVRTAKVVVLDEGTRVEVNIRVSAPSVRLNRDEITHITKEAANLVAENLDQIRYLRARPDNTVVTV